MIKYASFFGGAIKDTSTPEYAESVKIGALLAHNNFNVLNGGYGGLMEAVSKGATEVGGVAIGYTCATFGPEKGNQFLTGETRLSNIYQRLESLIDDNDVFIAQKGGIGTLAEVFLTWDVYRKEDKKPPIFLIGTHWKPIVESVIPVTNEKERGMLIICENYDVFEFKFKIWLSSND